VPLQAIRRSLVANPLVVLDEIEKAGTRSENGRLVDSLIPFLELETARETFDPYLECPVDLSAVAYIATANSLSGIPGPLLDRFRVLEIPVPRREHLPAIIRTMTQDVRAERGGDPAWMPDLDGEEIQLIANQWDGGSMRRLRRMVEVMLSGRETLAARH
jgi:hypothetical protein